MYKMTSPGFIVGYDSRRLLVSRKINALDIFLLLEFLVKHLFYNPIEVMLQLLSNNYCYSNFIIKFVLKI